MPEQRLQRTRDPKSVVPPCVRLGHEWRYYVSTDVQECIRCGLRPSIAYRVSQRILEEERKADTRKFEGQTWARPSENAAEQLERRAVSLDFLTDVDPGDEKLWGV